MSGWLYSNLGTITGCWEMYPGFIVIRNSKTRRYDNDCHEVFTYGFQETGGTECHAGPHREAGGLGERQEEGEDS